METKSIVFGVCAVAAVALAYTAAKQDNLCYRLKRMLFKHKPKFNVIMIGPPGSGKSTQGSMIAEEHGLGHLVIGNIIKRR